MAWKHKLGEPAKDAITGFKGIIVSRCEHLTGCNTYGLKPKVDKEGKLMEAQWFDESRIEVTGKAVKLKTKKDDKPGADFRDHPSV